MAEVIWSDPALADLDAIADYIALENRPAAQELVRRIFGHADQLEKHPDSGSKTQEFRGWRCRVRLSSLHVASFFGMTKSRVAYSSCTSCVVSRNFDAASWCEIEALKANKSLHQTLDHCLPALPLRSAIVKYR
ncbi:MAG: type II toxin-antitoxin system RelE/ParE family toxin [Woeseiaceae bacterium]|nr:type II toxin-antitoxin system RelE/ParE family toxin [Woeseiaceae bacterium]